MKDHEIKQLINDLTACAIKYRDAQQLREQIRAIVIKAVNDEVGKNEVPL